MLAGLHVRGALFLRGHDTEPWASRSLSARDAVEAGGVNVMPYGHAHRMGGVAAADPLFDPRLRVFPPDFVVTPPEGPARE